MRFLRRKKQRYDNYKKEAARIVVEAAKASAKQTEEEPKKIDKKKSIAMRLLMTVISLAVILIFLPKIICGATGIAIIKEAMSGDYKIVDRIMDKIIGRKK